MSMPLLGTEARERLLLAAEHLFAEKGYGPVTLRDIGLRAGIHHSSVYHHVPGGKEELFVEVTERMLQRHHTGLTQAIQAGGGIRQQLYAVADWLLSQPPIDLLRLEHVDMPAIHLHNAQHITAVAYQSLQGPLEIALNASAQRGEIIANDFSLVSGGLIGMIESLYAVSEQNAGKKRPAMAHTLIDILVDGLYTRH